MFLFQLAEIIDRFIDFRHVNVFLSATAIAFGKQFELCKIFAGFQAALGANSQPMNHTVRGVI